ncbi:FHA domain-containing protein [Streptomyces sp. NPDC048242]|uniref:FHA domain-containing protein n=1 Tax=Streptomyces sp. NPDC048242 TaxID=3155026 RepID=UPI003435BD10
MPTCPNGHQSGSDDWCEVCGHRMAGAVPPPPPSSGGYGFPPPRAEGRPASSPNPELCPQCRTPREGGAPFCEECRWNFLTNTATSYTPASPPGGGRQQPRFQPPSASYGGGDGYEYQGSRPSQVNRPAEPIPPFDNEPSGPTPFGAARGGGPATPPQTAGGPSAFGGRPGGPGGPGGPPQGFGGGQGGPGGAPGNPGGGAGGPGGAPAGQGRQSMFERERPGQGGGQGGPGSASPYGNREQSGPGGQGGQGGQSMFSREPSGQGGIGGPGAPGGGAPSPFDRGPSAPSAPGGQGTQGGGGAQPPYGRDPSGFPGPGGPSGQAPSAFGGTPSRQAPPPGPSGYPQQGGQPNNGGPSFGGGADDWVISPPSSPSQNGPAGGYGYPQPGGQQGPSGYQQRPATWTVTIGPDREYFMAMMQRSGPEAAGLNLPAYSPEQQRPLTGNQLTIGRRRHSTGDTPDIDLSVPPEDPGVSHQHAVLVQQPDGNWAVVDQNSTNGTTVNGGDEPIQPFVPVPLQDGDRVHVGAWTTITLRRG